MCEEQNELLLMLLRNGAFGDVQENELKSLILYELSEYPPPPPENLGWWDPLKQPLITSEKYELSWIKYSEEEDGDFEDDDMSEENGNFEEDDMSEEEDGDSEDDDMSAEDGDFEGDDISEKNGNIEGDEIGVQEDDYYESNEMSGKDGDFKAEF